MQVLEIPTLIGNGVRRGHVWRAEYIEFLNDLLDKVKDLVPDTFSLAVQKCGTSRKDYGRS